MTEFNEGAGRWAVNYTSDGSAEPHVAFSNIRRAVPRGSAGGAVGGGGAGYDGDEDEDGIERSSSLRRPPAKAFAKAPRVGSNHGSGGKANGGGGKANGGGGGGKANGGGGPVPHGFYGVKRNVEKYEVSSGLNRITPR